MPDYNSYMNIIVIQILIVQVANAILILQESVSCRNTPFDLVELY